MFQLIFPGIDTGISVGSGWIFSTGSCTASYKQQLQTTQFPVFSRPPGQNGPIKTSPITPSLCLCMPSLIQLKEKKQQKKKCAQLSSAAKRGFTCVPSVVLLLPPPLPRPSFISHTILCWPLFKRRSEGKEDRKERLLKFLLMECQGEPGSDRGQMFHRKIHARVEKCMEEAMGDSAILPHLLYLLTLQESQWTREQPHHQSHRHVYILQQTCASSNPHPPLRRNNVLPRGYQQPGAWSALILSPLHTHRAERFTTLIHPS